MIMWRERIARLAALALLCTPAAACEPLVTVWGSVGVTVNDSGGLVFVGVWCEGAPDSMRISEEPFPTGGLNVLYEREGLAENSSATLDASAPAPWRLTEGVPAFADGVSYSAGMGKLGERSDDRAVVFRPEDVRGRVTPGEVLFASLTGDGDETATIGGFEAAVWQACRATAPPASTGGASNPTKPG